MTKQTKIIVDLCIKNDWCTLYSPKQWATLQQMIDDEASINQIALLIWFTSTNTTAPDVRMVQNAICRALKAENIAYNNI